MQQVAPASRHQGNKDTEMRLLVVFRYRPDHLYRQGLSRKQRERIMKENHRLREKQEATR